VPLAPRGSINGEEQNIPVELLSNNDAMQIAAAY
jgi:hypothetical protein